MSCLMVNPVPYQNSILLTPQPFALRLIILDEYDDMTDRLFDAVALVTGGSSGIGLGIARALSVRGATVLLADVDPNVFSTAKSLAEDTGGKVCSVSLDVSDPAHWNRVANELVEDYGGISILCNNAGISTPRAPVGNYDIALWQKVMDVNLTGVFLGCSTLLSSMRLPGQKVRILNTASVSGLFATPQLAAYTASKHGVLALSDAIRFERKDENITVSVLCPGFVNTRIASNSRNLAGEKRVGDAERLAMTDRLAHSMDPDTVGEIAIEGLLAEQPYIFTHPEYSAVFERRVAAIRPGFLANHGTGPQDDIHALGAAWLEIDG